MTQRWTTRDVWAKFFIDQMMKRKNEPGYTDEHAIHEGFRLADYAMKIRKGVKRPKRSTQEGAQEPKEGEAA